MYYVKLFHIISYLILNTLDTGALLNITLDGDAKLAQGHTEGYYTLNSMDNGKPNWIQVQGSCAIWYDQNRKDWKNRSKEKIGTSTCHLYSTKNTKRPEEATTWMYGKDGGWLPTSNIFGSTSMY